ncbi:MAG TPA: FlgD immunoglobulin-like domain containing protein [Gaiellales bacterium]|nr:FlgD immunoglobulin-like domain containing protein [Gaiellales bacterium]
MASRRFSLGLIGVLVAASALSFAAAELVKLAPATVARPQVPRALSLVCPPGPRCAPGHVARISFLLRTRSRLELTMVNAAGSVVATLPTVAGEHPRGTVRTTWDGRTGSGRRAPDGRYHVRVKVLANGRTYTLPEVLVLDDVAPVLRLAGTPGLLPLRYRLDAPATVYVAFKPVAGGRGTVLRGHRGTVVIPRGRLAPGRYRVSMIALDAAGNLSRPVAAGTVAVAG